MWFRRVWVFILCAGLSAVLLWGLAPQRWFWQGGTVDLGVLIDYSPSYVAHLNTAYQATDTLLKAVLREDRIAIYAVGPEVIELGKGLASQALLDSIRGQIDTLAVSETKRSALHQGLDAVGNALTQFAEQFSQERTRLRILAVFSDGVNAPSARSQNEFPGSTSVLVVGLESSDKSLPFVRVLQGIDGSNDVHIIPPAEAGQAIKALLKAIRKAHSFNWSVGVLAFLSCLLFAALVTTGAEMLMSRKKHLMTISLQRKGEYGGAQEFSLFPGNSLHIGGGDGSLDYFVPVRGHCLITRSRKQLMITPGMGQLTIRRRGEDHPVQGPMPLAEGDVIVLEGREIELACS